MKDKRLSQLSLVIAAAMIGAITTRATSTFSPEVSALVLGLAVLLMLLSIRLKS